MDGKIIYKKTIPLPPVTKKNSQNIVTPKGSSHPIVIQSKKYKDYERTAIWYLTSPPEIEEPVNIEMLFYMPTHRRVDLSNLQSACLDVLVKACVIKDDNCKIVVAHDGSRVLYDKENPRTEVTITAMEEAETL